EKYEREEKERREKEEREERRKKRLEEKKNGEDNKSCNSEENETKTIKKQPTIMRRPSNKKLKRGKRNSTFFRPVNITKVMKKIKRRNAGIDKREIENTIKWYRDYLKQKKEEDSESKSNSGFSYSNSGSVVECEEEEDEEEEEEEEESSLEDLDLDELMKQPASDEDSEEEKKKEKTKQELEEEEFQRIQMEREMQRLEEEEAERQKVIENERIKNEEEQRLLEEEKKKEEESLKNRFKDRFKNIRKKQGIEDEEENKQNNGKRISVAKRSSMAKRGSIIRNSIVFNIKPVIDKKDFNIDSSETSSVNGQIKKKTGNKKVKKRKPKKPKYELEEGRTERINKIIEERLKKKKENPVPNFLFKYKREDKGLKGEKSVVKDLGKSPKKSPQKRKSLEKKKEEIKLETEQVQFKVFNKKRRNTSFDVVSSSLEKKYLGTNGIKSSSPKKGNNSPLKVQNEKTNIIPLNTSYKIIQVSPLEYDEYMSLKSMDPFITQSPPSYKPKEGYLSRLSSTKTLQNISRNNFNSRNTKINKTIEGTLTNPFEEYNSSKKHKNKPNKSISSKKNKAKLKKLNINNLNNSISVRSIESAGSIRNYSIESPDFLSKYNSLDINNYSTENKKIKNTKPVRKCFSSASAKAKLHLTLMEDVKNKKKKEEPKKKIIINEKDLKKKKIPRNLSDIQLKTMKYDEDNFWSWINKDKTEKENKTETKKKGIKLNFSKNELKPTQEIYDYNSSKKSPKKIMKIGNNNTPSDDNPISLKKKKIYNTIEGSRNRNNSQPNLNPKKDYLKEIEKNKEKNKIKESNKEKTKEPIKDKDKEKGKENNKG
ncbi:MAG: hypothetical protein MJ252_24235, partial [archaeon]|nr:hypothetical protein [archaeon]